jgi:DNA-binding Xre family transcriptional regulator
MMKRRLRNKVLELLMEKEKKLGRRIKFIEISEATGLANSIVSRWMNGKIERFDSEVLEKLGDYFECDLQDILFFEMVEDEAK